MDPGADQIQISSSVNNKNVEGHKNAYCSSILGYFKILAASYGTSISRVAEPEPAPTGMVYTYCTTWRETDRDQRLIARNGRAARDGLHIPGGRQTWTSEISLKRLIARDGQVARDGLHIPGGRQTWTSEISLKRLIARDGQIARDGLHIPVPGGRQTGISEISLKILIARDGQIARDGLHIPGGRQTGTSEISLKFINLSSSSRAMSRPKH